MSLIQGFTGLTEMFGGKKTAKKHPKKHSKKSAKKGGYKKRKTMKKRPKKVKGGSSDYPGAYGAGHHEEPNEDNVEGGEEGFRGEQIVGGKKHKRKTHKKKGGYEPTGVATAVVLTAAHMKKKGKMSKK